ncbi:ComEC/Rec2 family competence protein [Patescibacteria group bacterium]
MKSISASQIFIIALLGFVLGMFFGPEINFGLNQTLMLIFGFSAGLLFVYPNIWGRIAVIFLIFVLFGGLYFSLYQAFQKQNNASKLIGEQKTFVGTIVKDIEVDDKYQKIIIGNIRSQDQKYTGKILVYLPKYPRYKFGQTLSLEGDINKPIKFKNFDWQKYLQKEKVYATSYQPKVKSKKATSLNFQNTGLKIKGFLIAIKNRFIQNINKILSEPESGLLAGILLGMKQNMSEHLLEIFKVVGITHIIALSGYNVTIIVRAFLLLSASWSRKIAFTSAIIGIVFFVIMTGAQASVVRASIMAGIILLAERLGRKADILISLLLAAVLMSIFNPLIVRYDVGFQLSFLATAGLIFFSENILKWRWIKFVPKFFREHLVATLAALSLVLPVLIYYFGQLSIVAPLVNMLILPAVPVAMFFGFLSGILGFVHIILGQLIGFIAYILLSYIIWIAEIFAKIPFASIKLSKFGISFLILYYLLFVFVNVAYIKNRKNLKN